MVLALASATLLGCSAAAPQGNTPEKGQIRVQDPPTAVSAIPAASSTPSARAIPSNYEECAAMGGDVRENAKWNGGGMICRIGYDAAREADLFQRCRLAGGGEIVACGAEESHGCVLRFFSNGRGCRGNWCD
jgi:hypothetical protein